MIKVIIVDDQPLIREGLASLLGLRPELSVIGTAADGQEAFQKVLELAPDIVLMDIRMPGTSGVEGTRLITKNTSGTKVLMLTTFKDSDLIFQALEEGASGYLLKDMSTDTIVKAIQTVHSGGVVLPPDITAQMLSELKKTRTIENVNDKVEFPKELEELTERETDVLQQLGFGLSNKEIANLLFITEGTVKNHVSNLINKLGLRDRTQAAIFAVRYGITIFE
ncbi:MULTISPECIES: response regulator transcription factor [unclassified Bacillus (in: firmicutes)]|uniref:response regulator transcription factor n=1 Tax=unclassified Bacillus (in: firmicutes) TaxID=185979 RepID=UPI0008E6B006|nr:MULTISPECIES: response regulator transcription factor [unclassified Bacillus (in: firmicutes)]SFB09588.1 DNA-binding response regulator, NarL/FixJ family, contains REC and HTH domains [Bacillus sp. UNCCL13]SFQ86648.1 DNA-binding response regulator, NarL/FixJ family, contains REC and HTH domains [Bacillus sp. cl95]